MFLNILKAMFGGDRNVISETAGVFAVNKELQAQRDQAQTSTAVDQFGKEFQSTNRQHWFDRLMDGVNRLPRPTMALGIIGLFISAMVNPIWFSERMVGIALIPDPMWWLLGAIVAFYFGGRHQSKVQNFSVERQMAGVEAVVASRRMLNEMNDEQDKENELLQANISEDEIKADLLAADHDDNAVLAAWKDKERAGH